MASIERRRGSTVWTAHFRDGGGVQRCRSTYLEDKRAAQRVADEYEAASRKEQSLRKISAVLSEMRGLVGSRHISVTLREYATTWLAEKKSEVAPATFTFYSQVSRDFLGHVGEAADYDIALITKAMVAGYRSHVAASVSPNTVNHHLVAVRMLFRAARRDGVIVDDPAEFVGAVKAEQSGSGRRAFTIPELEAVLSVADDEWRSMILFGLYTGQRLGDLASLTWANVDLGRGELRLVTEKTGRQIILPLATALRSHIESLPSSDDVTSPIHPQAAAANKKTLSGQFAELLVQAGLRAPRGISTVRGIGRRHLHHELTFHSLRHTTVSLLHASGVAQDVSEAFAGHSSNAVHKLYIHSDRESLQRAADLLPILQPRRG